LNPASNPRPADKPPSGSNWIHEIKHDGYRAITRKDGSRVNIYSRVDAGVILPRSAV
jgi:ATP-dependent DNA ligase